MIRQTRKVQWLAFATSTLAILALASIPAAAQDAPLCPVDHDGRVADVFYSTTKIVFEPIVEHERLTLSVGTPCGDVIKTFDRGDTPIFDLADVPGEIDGSYSWELRVEPVVSSTVRAKLKLARATGDLEIPLELQREGLLPSGPLVDAAGFSVVNGRIVDPNSEEEHQATGGSASPGAGATAIGEMTSAGAGLMTPVPSQVVLSNADGVIRNSLCVGFDCPNSPSFSDSTTLFMENNTRLKFDDTSTLSGFPHNDWELKANDTNSGGRNYLAFADCGNSSQGGCADDEVFVVEAGVRENALYVESDGDVGIGTQNPVLRLHLVDNDSPGMRLEQDGSGGFAPQTWDVAGNETSFFVRDVTAGSRLPFRIRPGAPTSSIDIAADGDVGIGTSSPDAPLHVERSSAAGLMMQLEGNGDVFFRQLNSASGQFVDVNLIGDEFRINFGTGGAGPELRLTNMGSLIITGTYTPDYVFDAGYELMPIDELADFVGREKHLPNVPNAAEVKAQGINVNNFPMQLLEKIEELTLYTIDQHQKIETQQTTIETQQRSLAELGDLNAQLQARLAAIEQAVGLSPEVARE